jgi:hypothetical protein
MCGKVCRMFMHSKACNFGDFVNLVNLGQNRPGGGHLGILELQNRWEISRPDSEYFLPKVFSPCRWLKVGRQKYIKSYEKKGSVDLEDWKEQTKQ